MPYTSAPIGNQFTRNFGVPIDRDFVFQTTAARTGYISNPDTSGIAYTGMIVADLETNKVYLLNSSRAWQEVGITVNETFGANNSGILFKTGNNTFNVGGLNSGANISITNPSGLLGNPTILLNSSLTGLSNISGNNNFTIASNSGINIDAGSGVVSVDDLTVNGYLAIGAGIDIMLAARILAQGPIAYSGNPTIYSGAVYYDQTPYVGPTGGGAVPVSLSGHSHVYSDITNFCSGVASCVDTSLLPGTGIQFISGGNSLSVGLSGQALAIHNLNTNGLVARSAANTFASRTISPSGSNIWIGNGDGVSDNPSVGLNPNVAISSLGVTNNVDITGNLIIEGNLTVNGDTVVTNVATVQVEDPVIRIGGTGTLSNSDNKDRGIEFIYQTGNGVPITGFFGFDYSSRSFTLLTNTNNSSEIYTGGTSGLLNVGGLFSSGGISGTVLTSTIASPSAPISVTSTGQVNNLNSDYLDGQHGSYYVNSANLTGTINNSVLPVASTTNSGIVRFDGDNFIFNTNGIVSARNIVYTTGIQTISGVKTFENRPVLNSGLSIKNTTTTSVSGFAVFSGDPTAGTAFTVDYRSIGNIRSDLGTSTNTADRLVLRDSNGDFASRYISVTGISGVQTVGSMTSVYTSTSISGLNNTTYLANFIIDGGTP